ncbi:MAG: glycerophosphodiester phosphodiesterase [Mogibacterium sp.]|nr:glycerophosphodiester phosphodiesterase [Mogibacterium sp.]
MKRTRRVLSSLLLIALMISLCLIAGVYIVKVVRDRAEQQRQAEAAVEETVQTEDEVEAEASQVEQQAEASKAEKVYAYRGSSEDGLYTMAAYEKAVEAGAGTIAIPFVVSKDGTLYVADDDYAESLTGYGGYFSGMSDGQIDSLETKSGTKVLKLGDVFDKFGKDVRYVIEMKYTSERNMNALREMLEKYGNEESVSISCQYFRGLRSLESSLPDVQKIFICQDEAAFGESRNLNYIDTIAVSRDFMDEEVCRDVHEHGKKFSVWTLNTEEDIKRALEIGADSFFTDEAAIAVGVEAGAAE